MDKEFLLQVEDKYFHVEFKLNLTKDMIIKALKAVYALTNYSELNGVWQFSGNLLDIDFAGMLEIVAFIESNYSPEWQNQKTALVVEKQSSFGLARMYQSMAERFPYKVEIFTKLDEAIKWVNS